MAEERKKPKEEKRIIPLHFQTFGDMMMNMLTLFILLCSFAKERQAQFFEAGVGSFRDAISSLGLPGLMPSDTNPFNLDSSESGFRSPEEPDDGKPEDPSDLDTADDVDISPVPRREESAIPGSVVFGRARARIGGRGADWLDEQITLIRGSPLHLVVEGHAFDECDGTMAHYRLSERRAYAVIRYLNETGGIPLRRMHAVGFGDSRPVTEAESDPGLNRRVNLRITKDDNR